MYLKRREASRLRIDIWSDFACPFCYIGKRNLEKALEELEIVGKVDIVFHSFQLDPDAKKDNQSSILEILSKKYKIDKDESQRMIDRVVDMAKDVGLNYNYDKVVETNTFDAHRLVHYAKEENKDEEIIERLFKAYFIEGLDIGDIETLARISKESGLDREGAMEVLGKGGYSAKVNSDKDLAKELGITSVPFFVINNKTAIPGAQSSHVFLKVLDEIKDK